MWPFFPPFLPKILFPLPWLILIPCPDFIFSDVVAVKQSQVDKLYAGLKDLARERRAKLDEALQLFTLNREIDDLEQWINEKEVVASSQDLGQDYDHVTVSKNIIFFWCAPNTAELSLLAAFFFLRKGYKILLFAVIVGTIQAICSWYGSHWYGTCTHSQRHGRSVNK